MSKIDDNDDIILEKDEQLSKFYKKEYDEYLNHQVIINDESKDFDDLKASYRKLHKTYYKSIKKMMKITNIGDSTQLKLIKAQEILREQEEKIRAVFDNAVIGLSSLSLNGEMITSNTNLSEMLNIDNVDNNSINIKDFIYRPEDIQLFEEKCKEIQEDKIKTFRDKLQLKGRNGVFWSDFSISAIYNTKDIPESLIVIIANIDEEVKAKNELEESYRKLKNAQDEILNLERKNTALAMIVTANHEINQPLMIMKANLEMLEMTLPEDVKCERVQKYMERIDQSLERINLILEKFRSHENIEFEEYGGNTKMVSFRLNNDEEFDS